MMTAVIEKLKHGFRKGNEMADACRVEVQNGVPLPYAMDYLTPSLLEEAVINLKETEETRAKCLEELRELIENETNLLCPMDDTFLLAFLRSRKFDVKKAFKLLQNHWRFRKDHKDIYDNSDSVVVKKLLLKNMIGFLPYRDKNGCAVMVAKIGLWNPEEDSYEDMFRAITGLLIHSIRYPATQIAGYRVILDARELSWTQLKMATPKNIKLLVHSTQFCFPARYKGCHILSENKFFNLLWTVVYPLLTSKLKKRIMLHGSDLIPLKEFIHTSVLPDEFGGEAGPFENSKWSEIIEESKSQVLDMLNYGYQD